MTTRTFARLLSTLVLVGISFLASPAHAVNFGPVVNVSNSRADAGTYTDQIAVSGTNVYLVWSEKSSVLFSRSTNSGSTFSTPTSLFPAGDVRATVASSGSNVYVAQSRRAKPHVASQVYYRRSTNNGATFGSEVQVSHSNADWTAGAFFEGLAVSGSNVYVVWHESVGTQWDVFMARSIDGGASFFPPVNLSNTAANSSVGVSVLADGSNVYVAWTESVGIVFRASHDSGANFGSLINIGTGYFAALAVSGLNVYVAYNLGISGASDGNIFVAQSIDGGLSFGTPTNVSGAPAGPSQIVANGADVHVVWTVNNPSGPDDLFYAHSNDAGAIYSLPTNMSNSATDSTGVVAASGPNVYVSWSDGSEVFMARSGDSGNTFDPVANVSASSSGASNYVATVATSTGIHHVWLDHTPGNWDVFYRTGTP